MLLQAGIFLLLVYSVLVGVIYFKQDSMIYLPRKEMLQTPDETGLEYEEISFMTKDGIRISGWYIEAENEKGVLLFCHGNAGNISYRLDSIRIFNSLNVSVFIFDYRGYGNSHGKPSEHGTYLDADAAWDYLINVMRKSPETIVVFGRSLGGAVAAEIALRKSPAGLILESGFTSVPDFGRKLYPWLPVKLILKYKYSTAEKIGRIKCPKLIIHSSEDDIVPVEHGRKLYEKACQPKEFLEIRGGHNDGFLVSGITYTEGLRKFFEKLPESDGN